jgi:retinol-binding protein 3
MHIRLMPRTRLVAGLAAIVVVVLACGAPGPDDRVDAAFVQQTVTALGGVVGREYFDPLVGHNVANSLGAALREGRYGGLTNIRHLSRRLTDDLFAATHDKHLAVSLVRRGAANRSIDQPDTARAEQARRSNYGVGRVEILAGNIGLLRIKSFYRPNEAGAAIAAAMAALASVDAVILDLRDNGGGSPDTVSHVASYFFDRPGLPLFDVVDRSGAHRHYATLDPPPPGHNGRRPTYVLTDGRTFSGGEGLAFLLQEQHRAEVVGETTAGAANPGRPYPINERLEVTVPNGQVRAAVTGRNWEGTGVVPDVRASGNEALRVARVHALRALAGQAAPGPSREKLVHELQALER